MRWYDDRRKMRSKSFRTKREAEAWRAEIEHELREGSYRDRRLGQTSFGEVAEEWLATRTDITLSSKRSYRLLLDRHVLPRWAPVAVAAIRRRDIATWVAGLGEHRWASIAGRSASTTRHA